VTDGLSGLSVVDLIIYVVAGMGGVGFAAVLQNETSLDQDPAPTTTTTSM
jgi:hypothetical protein